MREPTLKKIIDKLELVLQNKLTKEEVADWAAEYVMTYDHLVTDLVVFDFLTVVSGLDTLEALENTCMMMRILGIGLTSIRKSDYVSSPLFQRGLFVLIHHFIQFAISVQPCNSINFSRKIYLLKASDRILSQFTKVTIYFTDLEICST
ncbi:hypothetical protein J32TS2_30340 [Shouchella clausii]|nr:hypothetical protein J32TS2_30340 [Shouchella clausii]